MKYPGFEKKANSKTRWEYLDQDYIDKLSPKDKQWLSNFMAEYISGNFTHKGKKFHKTDQERRDCYNRNNARNRCTQTIAGVTGYLVPMGEAIKELEETTSKDHEDHIIEIVDENIRNQLAAEEDGNDE